MDTTTFYIVLFVHLAALVLAFGSVLVTDLYGSLWLVGRVPYRQVVRVSGVTEYFVWAGYSLMVATGVPLLIIKGTIDNLMWLKLFFVVLIGVNGWALHRIQHQAEQLVDRDELPPAFMFRSALSLGASQLGWWGAVVIGFLHRHVQSVIRWPPSPWPAIAAALIVVGLVAAWLGGEWIVGRRSAPA